MGLESLGQMRHISLCWIQFLVLIKRRRRLIIVHRNQKYRSLSIYFQFLPFLLGGLMAMSSCSCSLPLSPGTFDPGNFAKTRSDVSFIIRNNVDESGNTSKRSCSVGRKPNLLSTTTRRREAIGMGLGFVELIAWQFPWQSQIAGAAETAPCELTVAPSGLAYCDKVVGTGPEAVKGQLIKVMSLMT